MIHFTQQYESFYFAICGILYNETVHSLRWMRTFRVIALQETEREEAFTRVHYIIGGADIQRMLIFKTEVVDFHKMSLLLQFI